MPDFVIIGAMKSATSTLYDQLARQPGIFMSTPKEPNFFSDDAQFRKGADWYQGLFQRAAPLDLRGEASTHYTKLPTHPHTVQRLKAMLGGSRFIYVMRHPVDRLVSHYIHAWTMGDTSAGIDETVSTLPETVDYGRYSMQLLPYFEAFGPQNVLPVFFDRLLAAPQAELERLCRFIGYAGKPVWDHELPASNVSATRLRRLPLQDALIWSGPATWLRRRLVPKGLRERIKRGLRMTERAELSASARARVEAVFDADLAVLGKWLGTDLNCANFKAVTRAQTLEWVNPPT